MGAPAKRLLIASVVSVVVLALAAPVQAAVEFGFVRGTVFSTTGNPALGARVFVSDAWGVVQEDGSFSLSIHPGEFYVDVFNGVLGMNPADYPYQDIHLPDTIVVTSNHTTTVNIVLPLKEEPVPELGAVQGTVPSPNPDVKSGETAYLIGEDGVLHGSYADEAGRYVVAAPPGQYRLYVTPLRGTGDWIAAFFGDHARGYAASWDEATTVEVTSAGVTEMGFNVPATSGTMRAVEDDPNAGGVGLAVGTEETDSATISILDPEMPDLFERVARQVVGTPPHSVEDYRLLAYPSLRDPSPVTVRIVVRAPILGDYTAQNVPVWLDFRLLQDCGVEPAAPCILERAERGSVRIGPYAYIEVAVERGGVFTLGDRPQFYDSESSVFGEDIRWLADNAITLGCNPPVNDRFCPDAAVTRGQMAAFLVRALGLSGSSVDVFVDDDESIFEADIQALRVAGITLGCNPPVNDRFCPEAAVTRGQMAAFLRRALG